MLIQNQKTTNSNFNMGLNPNSKAYALLSYGLYKKPYHSIIREVVSNAIDACRVAGTEEPVIVHIPINANEEFYIQDFGIGMSIDTLFEVFAIYMNSTKEGDSEQIGGFGLGGKTPFAYTNQFVVETTSPDDSVRRTFIFQMNDNIPNFYYDESLDVVDSDIKGTKVSFKIKKHEDIKNFYEALKEIAFVKYPVIVEYNGGKDKHTVDDIKSNILGFSTNDIKALKSLDEKGYFFSPHNKDFRGNIHNNYSQFDINVNLLKFEKEQQSGKYVFNSFNPNYRNWSSDFRLYIRCGDIVYPYDVKDDNPVLVKIEQLASVINFINRHEIYNSNTFLFMIDSPVNGKIAMTVSREELQDSQKNEQTIAEMISNVIDAEIASICNQIEKTTIQDFLNNDMLSKLLPYSFAEDVTGDDYAPFNKIFKAMAHKYESLLKELEQLNMTSNGVIFHKNYYFNGKEYLLSKNFSTLALKQYIQTHKLMANLFKEQPFVNKNNMAVFVRDLFSNAKLNFDYEYSNLLHFIGKIHLFSFEQDKLTKNIIQSAYTSINPDRYSCDPVVFVENSNNLFRETPKVVKPVKALNKETKKYTVPVEYQHGITFDHEYSVDNVQRVMQEKMLTLPCVITSNDFKHDYQFQIVSSLFYNSNSRLNIFFHRNAQIGVTQFAHFVSQSFWEEMVAQKQVNSNIWQHIMDCAKQNIENFPTTINPNSIYSVRSNVRDAFIYNRNISIEYFFKNKFDVIEAIINFMKKDIEQIFHDHMNNVLGVSLQLDWNMKENENFIKDIALFKFAKVLLRLDEKHQIFVGLSKTDLQDKMGSNPFKNIHFHKSYFEIYFCNMVRTLLHEKQNTQDNPIFPNVLMQYLWEEMQKHYQQELAKQSIKAA